MPEIGRLWGEREEEMAAGGEVLFFRRVGEGEEDKIKNVMGLIYFCKNKV